MNTTDGAYSHGHAGRMRVARAALGLSTAEFSRRFNVKRRTVQRIETGMDPLPIGLWADVQEAVDGLRARVDIMLDAFDRGETVRVIDVDDHDTVQAAALIMVAHDRGEFTPMARTDMEGTAGSDQEVPEPVGGSGPARGPA